MFSLQSPFSPSGDQPQAIAELIHNIEAGQKMQGLKGVMNLTLASLSSKIHVVVTTKRLIPSTIARGDVHRARSNGY